MGFLQVKEVLICLELKIIVYFNKCKFVQPQVMQINLVAVTSACL